MATLKSSELKYGVPVKTSIGGLFLTATRVETPASATYSIATTEALTINLANIGLTGKQVAGLTGTLPQGLNAESKEVASTTALPVLAWCTHAVEAKTENEKAVAKIVAFTQLSGYKGTELQVRFYAQLTAGLKGPSEEANAELAIGSVAFTVFAIGK